MTDEKKQDLTSEDLTKVSENELTKTPEKKWYIIRAQVGKQMKVVENLKDRIKLEGMESKFGEIRVPTEEVMEMRSGQKRKSKRKFYPGYVLVQIEMNDDVWHFVKRVPKVAGFIGGDTPTPISDAEVNAILQREQEGTKKPRPKVSFAAGEVVRIIEGPFADFDGVVEDVNYEKNRLKVLVSIFGRSTPVELEFGQVQKA